MISCLGHRGPDHQGEISFQVNGLNIYLGHRRLKIIDLSDAGNQPMSNVDKKTIIVFNGEIYNYKHLKNKYLKQYSFKSSTDTEVLLYLYLELGLEFLKLLNGDFALGILDMRNQKMLLARDRCGVKPLYYYQCHDSLVFASELKSFVAAGIPLNLDIQNIQKYLIFKYNPGDETLCKNIKRLPPGTFAQYDLRSGEMTIQKYWIFDKNQLNNSITFVEAKSILNKILQDATTIRLMSDVPVGNFLSGGTDSSIITSFIKDRTDIIHYCARKNIQDLNNEGTTSDYCHAEQLARSWNLKLHPVDIGSSELNKEIIRKTIFYSDDLIADGSQIPSYLITKEASKSSKVILSGMGADEIFFGYAGHQLALLSQYFEKLPRCFSHAFGKIAFSLKQGKGSWLSYRRYLHKFGKYINYPHYKYGLFSIVGDFENALSVYNGKKEETIGYLEKYFPEKQDVFESLMNFEIDNFLVKNLHYLDRMAMANSVEARVPYLDHRLVEFAYNLPWKYKLSWNARPKLILKDTFKSVLPSHVRHRRKAGFGMPLRSIFSSKEKIDALLDRQFFSQFPGFNLKNIDAMITSHLYGREDTSNLIYALISFQEWHKIFIEGEAVL